jgi:hypothetical protein
MKMSYKLNYELRAMSIKVYDTSYKIRDIRYELRDKRYDIKNGLDSRLILHFKTTPYIENIRLC